MKLIKCPNNHYYDSDRFSTCPHCQAAGDGAPVTVALNSNGKPNDATTPMYATSPSYNSNLPSDDMPTAGGPSRMGVPAPADPGATVKDDPTSSLVGAVSQVIQPINTGTGKTTVPDDDGKTISLYQTLVSNSNDKDTLPGQSIPAKTTEPVVGFLICIDGKDFGRAFPLKTGRNFIGRDASMDVCLSGEMSVSKDRHAIVVYEPKKNLFLVMSGESKGLVYKNGDVVLVPETLEKNDVLQVGSVSLMLLPFCDDKFSWSRVSEFLENA